MESGGFNLNIQPLISSYPCRTFCLRNYCSHICRHVSSLAVESLPCVTAMQENLNWSCDHAHHAVLEFQCFLLFWPRNYCSLLDLYDCSFLLSTTNIGNNNAIFLSYDISDFNIQSFADAHVDRLGSAVNKQIMLHCFMTCLHHPLLIKHVWNYLFGKIRLTR